MPLVDDVTPARLRQIARGRPDGGAVLSVLVDLDPTSLPTPAAREAAITSAVDSARREVERHDLSRDERLRLREVVAALDGALEPVRGARALAAYAPLHDDSTEVDVLRLPEPVHQTVAIDRLPLVEPLVGLAVGEHWCVALVDRSTARFYLGDRHALELTNAFDDEVHSRHDQGGWSQANYQRSIEADVHHHLMRVATALQRALLPNGLYDHLLIGCAQPMRAPVTERLHPAVRERLAGWLEVDISAARDSNVREAAGAAIASFDAERRTHALDRLQAAVGRPDGAGAHGWPEVLRALSERRVGELFVDDGDHPAGGRCPRCGLLAVAGDERCPADGSALDAVADVAQAAIAAAYAQDADVLVLHDEPRLLTLGGVGAVLRF